MDVCRRKSCKWEEEPVCGCSWRETCKCDEESICHRGVRVVNETKNQLVVVKLEF